MRLFDFGMTDTGSFYYVMERLRGMDLQRMVERHGPLPPDRTVFLLQQATGTYYISGVSVAAA